MCSVLSSAHWPPNFPSPKADNSPTNAMRIWEMPNAGIELNTATYSRQVSIIGKEDGNRLIIQGNTDISTNWWSFGKLTFLSGPYANQPLRIASHLIEQGKHKLTLWSPLMLEQTYPVTATISAGCDKSWSSCQTKFQNTENFRGFPHMPGNDFILAGPESQSAANNGEKLVG